MNQENLPTLPPGWIGLWDEATERYYYVEEATGKTQWEFPSEEAAAAFNNHAPGMGEAASYGTRSMPSTTTTGNVSNDRGIGKLFTGFSGGAITGSLIGFAAGKYMTKHSYKKHNNYAPPPPPPPPNSSHSFFGFGKRDHDNFTPPPPIPQPEFVGGHHHHHEPRGPGGFDSPGGHHGSPGGFGSPHGGPPYGGPGGPGGFGGPHGGPPHGGPGGFGPPGGPHGGPGGFRDPHGPGGFGGPGRY